MEELKFEIKRVASGENSLGIAKGYGYQTKDGQQRYSFNEAYYSDGEKTMRKVKNENGEFYYTVELFDVVVETFVTKDGRNGQKVYPLTETPYLCADYESADLETLNKFLSFKLHR